MILKEYIENKKDFERRMITYKFRAYPTQDQIRKLWTHANRLNRLYNYFLEQRNLTGDYEITRYDQQQELVSLKQDDPSLLEIHSQVLQQVPLRLQKAFDKFHDLLRNSKEELDLRKDGKPEGYPRFRSCREFFGICYPQSLHFKILDNHVKVPKYGSIKISKHREIQGTIKQLYITTKDDKWYICITSEGEKKSVETSNSIIGIDLGITNIVATSDGEIIKNKNHAKYFDKQINQLKSRRDKKCKKYSRKWRFLSKTINKLYDAKSRKQSDFLHKVSYNLSQKFDTIVIENLQLKKMSESEITGLNRELRNSCLGQLISFLKYKSNRIIEVNPYNTSKMCNNCGKLHTMPLSDRTMSCSCGYVEDRDVNAAKNILCLGQAYLENHSDFSDSIAATQEAGSFRDQ